MTKTILSSITQATGNPIQDVTYVIRISNATGNNVFSEVVHGHDGKVELQFSQSDVKPYRVNVNYDNLAASYVPDFWSPIAIEGSSKRRNKGRTVMLFKHNVTQ